MALRLRLLLGASALALLLSAGPANAGLLPGTSPCPGTRQQPFAPWFDYASYVLAPSGSFESGASGWTLSGGARVVSGNEPFYVHAKGESRSLLIPSGGSATSPPVCMTLGQPVARFFATSNGGSGTLRVQVIARNLLGVLTVLDGGTVPASGDWRPTPPVGLLLSTLTAPLGTKSVQFRFTPVSGSANWQIDDVYVDPWLNR